MPAQEYLVESAGNDPASPACEAGALPIELRPLMGTIGETTLCREAHSGPAGTSAWTVWQGLRRSNPVFHVPCGTGVLAEVAPLRQSPNIVRAITAKAMSIWEESNLLLRLATACCHKHLTLSPSAFTAGEGSTDPPFR